MKWHLILKSDTFWDKLSDRIIQLNEPAAYNMLGDILTHARRVIRGRKKIPSKRDAIDDAYAELSDQAFRIFAFYNVFELYNERLSEKVARRLLPDVIIDIDKNKSILLIGSLIATRVDSLYELPSTHQEIARFKNFEGYTVYKTSDTRSAYDAPPKYRIDYYIKGFLFYIDTLNAMEYTKFLKEELRGKTMLESRQTRRENFPWRRIRARGR